MKKSLIFILFFVFVGIVFAKSVETVQWSSLRVEPNVQSASVTNIPPDIKCEVLDVFGDYVKVTDGKITGYVWEKLLIESDDGLVIGGQGCSVCTKPDKKTAKFVFKAGTKVKKLDVAATWYKVSYLGKIGWTYCKNVK